MNNEIINPKDEIKDKELISSSICRVYGSKGPWLGDDESLYSALLDTEDPSTLEPKFGNAKVIDNNILGVPGNIEVATIQIIPSSSLTILYPNAIVTVDGKSHDLAYLNSDIDLIMSKDHRITIDWAPEIKESFRVIRVENTPSTPVPPVSPNTLSVFDSSGNNVYEIEISIVRLLENPRFNVMLLLDDLQILDTAILSLEIGEDILSGPITISIQGDYVNSYDTVVNGDVYTSTIKFGGIDFSRGAVLVNFELSNGETTYEFNLNFLNQIN